MPGKPESWNLPLPVGPTESDGACLAGLDLCSKSQRRCYQRRVEGGPRLGFSWKVGHLPARGSTPCCWGGAGLQQRTAASPGSHAGAVCLPSSSHPNSRGSNLGKGVREVSTSVLSCPPGSKVRDLGFRWRGGRECFESKMKLKF